MVPCWLQVPIIYDTVDLHFIREARLALMQQQVQALAQESSQDSTAASWGSTAVDLPAIQAWLETQPAHSALKRSR